MDPDVTFKRKEVHVLATLLAVLLAVVTDTTTATCPNIEDNFTHMTLHNGIVYIAGSKCVCLGNVPEKRKCADINETIVVLEVVAKTHLLMCYTSGKCETRLLNGSDLYSKTPLELDPPIVGGMNTIVVPSSLSESSRETVLFTTTKVVPWNKTTSTLSVWNVTFQPRLSRMIYTIDDDLVDNVKRKYRENYNPVGGFSVNGVAYFFANQIENSSSVSNVSKLIVVCRNGTYHDIKVHDHVTDVILISESQNQEIFNSAHKTKYGVLILAVVENKSTNKSVLTSFTFKNINRASSGAKDMRGDRYLQNGTPSCQMKNDRQCQGCHNFIASSGFQLDSLSRLIESMDKIHKVTGAPINGGHHSLVLVALTQGSVQMLYIGTSQYDTPFLNGTFIRNLSIDGSSVRDMKIHDDHVIILYRNYTDKVLLFSGQCRENGTILLCLDRTNPFCGWCRKTRSCTRYRNCQDRDWIPVGASYGNVSVDNLTPGMGPMSGGSVLSLNGSNLHQLTPRLLNVSIGTKECRDVDIISHDVMTCITPRSDVAGLQNVTWMNVDGTVTPIGPFIYREDPTVAGISPNRSFDSGGRDLEISGTNFDAIQEPQMLIVGQNVSEDCRHKNATLIVCSAPKVTKDLRDRLEKNSTLDAQTDMIQVEVEFKMDGVNSSLLRQTLEIVRDPVFFNFSEEGMTKELVEGEHTVVVIKGERINVSAKATDLKVIVGTVECGVLSHKVYRTEFHFLAPVHRPATIYEDSAEPEVQVRLGYIHRQVGFLRYIPPSKLHLYLAIAVGILGLVVLALIIIGVLLRRRSRKAVEKMQGDMEQMELRIQTEFRQAFAELQTDMTDITGELVETGLPFNKFNVYAFQILFPTDDVTEMTSHKLARYPEIDCVDVTSLDTAMQELEGLFLNKFFVITIINTLEKQRKLSLSDKSTFAGCLAACLLQNMDFFSQLTKLLLEQYIPDAITRKKHKSLFRRCESITETLTSSWLGMCLHQHLLKSRGGSALIMLVKAMQTVMEKAPIDAVTGAARATLAYDQLLMAQTDNDKSLTLSVQINGGEFSTTCPVLECDTISQVKAKCLGIIYKKDPASVRPRSADVELQWLSGKQGKLILTEEDTCPAVDEDHVKLMTLSDYHVTDGSLMELLNKHTTDEEEDRYVNYKNLQQQQLTHSEVQLLVDDEEDEEEKGGSSREDAIRYHLTRPDEEAQGKTRMLPEAHLHKLLQTKMNVKKFVDDVIDSALDKKDIPVSVKYLFCILEGLAQRYDVDQDTLLSWKNNSYPIRFWGRLLSRPNIVFDIDSPDYLQPSLDIVASTFIDSFTSPQTLTKNSSPHKLLFFKDLEQYRGVVKSFHRGVSSAPAVDERDMAKEMHKLSYMQNFSLNKISVFYELFLVLAKFKDEIISDLEENKETSRLKLSEKLEHVLELMES